MNIPSLIRALRTLDTDATLDDLLQACRRLVLASDLIQLARVPFSDNECESISESVFVYITATVEAFREIIFEVPRPPLFPESRIEYEEFASCYSEGFLAQNYSIPFHAISYDEGVSKLLEFMAAIFFRYRYCATGDTAVFRVSVLLDYIDAARVVSGRHGKPCSENQLLQATLHALKSLEPYESNRAWDWSTQA